MTRREEIEKAATDYINSDAVSPMNMQLAFGDFINGAEWADKTMIEKARQWFNLHFRQVGTPKEIKHDFQSKEKMWKSFTQFMEE